jgi:hypothetical protein
MESGFMLAPPYSGCKPYEGFEARFLPCHIGQGTQRFSRLPDRIASGNHRPHEQGF